MAERGEPLGINEEAPIGDFLDHMREEVNGPLGSLFVDGFDPRLASVKATFVAEGPVMVSSSIDAPWFDEEDFAHGGGLYTNKTREFASQNDLEPPDISSQWEVVKEEIDELCRAFREFESLETTTAEGAAMQSVRGSLAGEMADVVFTIHLLAHLAGVNLREEFRKKADYNLQKSGDRNEAGKIIDDAEADNE